jgi:GH35 family endo-1,4-beta-xylanase
VTFNLGFTQQTVDIAALDVRNYGTAVELAALPNTSVTYEGREPDAPWRAPAEERIRQHRMADLKVTVLDPAGKPVPNAAVSFEQVRHGFGFGTSISATRFIEQNADAERYRQTALKYYDNFTIEWETMWANWDHAVIRDAVLQATSILKKHDKFIHGCHIHWGYSDNLPPELRNLASVPRETLRERMVKHIHDKVGALKGIASEWNVVNEVYAQNALWQAAGKEMIIESFRIAREIDPTLILGPNDYGDFANWDQKHIDAYYALIEELVKDGLRMDVIGLQGHFGTTVRSPQQVLEIVDRFASFGIPIHVTELDVNCADESFQADYLRDVLTVFFSHPGVARVTQWGFWQGNHWLPTAALWRQDWSEKAAALVYKDLVERRWRTSTTQATNAAGIAQVRGFKGDYRLSVDVGGRTISKLVTLGEPLSVTLQ